MTKDSPRSDVDAKPPCHPRAVNCLASNNYNEAKCQAAVRALYDCCDAFYGRYGNDASTPSCPMASLLQLKMRQLNKEK
ncbi:hypothetical protein CDD81_527 [Ophiocordyceps australis]|uniref:Cx9C motif-containing protein 4, mitochondrial n=1 Tax=Ophiocordyceps australis TaxID=1399860 RepID=A0A2C5XXW2_9HYPO|nr:hypothetical protein CDD81_527 [Ophiocordyceps australis]